MEQLSTSTLVVEEHNKTTHCSQQLRSTDENKEVTSNEKKMYIFPILRDWGLISIFESIELNLIRTIGNFVKTKLKFQASWFKIEKVYIISSAQ